MSPQPIRSILRTKHATRSGTFISQRESIVKWRFEFPQKPCCSGGGMTQGNVMEQVEAIRERYVQGSRKEKVSAGWALPGDTEYHRKAAMRLLGCSPRCCVGRRGCRCRYGPEPAAAPKAVWRATDGLCPRRRPSPLRSVRVLESYGRLMVTSAVRSQPQRMSPAMTDRLLQPYRRMGCRHTVTTAKPGKHAQSRHANLRCCRLGRRSPRVRGGRPGGPLRRERRGVLSAHPLYRGCGHGWMECQGV